MQNFSLTLIEMTMVKINGVVVVLVMVIVSDDCRRCINGSNGYDKKSNGKGGSSDNGNYCYGCSDDDFHDCLDV